MKVFFIKPQWSSLFPFLLNPTKPISTRSSPTQVSQILSHCKSGALFPAIFLLNSLNLQTVLSKPLLYASLLQTCTKVKSFNPGLQLHGHVLKSGLETDRFVGNSLLSLYFKLGPDFRTARRVFDGLFVRDVISWTSMITGNVKAGRPGEAFELCREMLGRGIEPNGFTLSAVIKACSDARELWIGRSFHGVVVVRGFESNCVISSALIDFYSRNCTVVDARRVFGEIPEPDMVCWTSIVSAYTRNGVYDKALEVFYFSLRGHGFLLDEFTFGTVLAACGNLERLKQGKEVHAKVVISGFSGNVVVESSLVDMYGKCRLLKDSQSVFDRMSARNSVSWSALLDAYCQNGDFESVLKVFRKVREFDLYSFGTVLRACAGLAAVRQGKEVHCQYLRRGGWRNVIIESALVDLYSKCGNIDFACRLFIQMPDKNLITWNSMVSGFAQNGRAAEALRIFDDMIMEGIRPDYISFLGVLFACSHAGFVDKGRNMFLSMTKEYGIRPGIQHYNCMVDLLSRAGLLEEAENLINNGECKDESSLWVILLGACASSKNYATAESIAKKTMESKPDYYLSYVYLANIYRAVGRWDDAAKIRRLMIDRGVKKIPGKSWNDTSGHAFLLSPATTNVCV